MQWRTSSWSTAQGNCVEVGWDWKTASYSAANTSCVETKADASAVHVRDTKDRDIPGFQVRPEAWASFIGMAASA